VVWLQSNTPSLATRLSHCPHAAHVCAAAQLLDGSMREHDGGGEGAVSAWWNPENDLANSWEMVKSSWLNVLLLACPFGIASHMLGWPATTVFLLVSGTAAPVTCMPQHTLCPAAAGHAEGDCASASGCRARPVVMPHVPDH
jgi:hypothetical protein